MINMWYIWGTGGGCTAWRLDLPGGGYVLVTNGDLSHDIVDGDTPDIGVYDAEGEYLGD
jgi:hypothetical protein